MLRMNMLFQLPAMASNSPTPSEELAPSLDDASCLFIEARTETVRMADINEFFICKLCKGYFRDPYTSKECLHTFCYGCIRGHYIYYPELNTCPTCGVKLGARPWGHFIPDPTMKELGEKLLPDYTEKEEAEGSIDVDECIRSGALTRYTLFAEREYYNGMSIKRKEPNTPLESQPSAPKVSRSLGPSPGNMIRFELHPQRGPDVPLLLSLNKLEAPCMHTQSLLKIMHIRKYLAKKMNVSKPEEIEILCNGAVVGPDHSLEFIRRTRWKDPDTKMILEYRRHLIAS
ncbi:Polycomb group RING finger protein 3 [Phytophthora citrophthora]|uniref:Polycomb group RING finger protein 3 n=1 Tax=Phytophthora citrophthora TaxID=4793 RepID=A0AAD9LD88_9STRA|nr:Polycomb group RING finger protein 3 [Phytophthora citrophthora]